SALRRSCHVATNRHRNQYRRDDPDPRCASDKFGCELPGCRRSLRNHSSYTIGPAYHTRFESKPSTWLWVLPSRESRLLIGSSFAFSHMMYPSTISFSRAAFGSSPSATERPTFRKYPQLQKRCPVFRSAIPKPKSRNRT